MSKISKRLIIFLIYILFAIILTYPLVFNFNNKIIAKDADTWDNLWLIWIGKYSLSNFTFDFFTDFQFYPVGINVLFEKVHLLLPYISVFFQLVFNLIATYNLILISGIVFSCFSVYLLAKYLIKDDWAAFVSGLVFGLSPLLFLDITVGSLELVHLEWMILYILFLWKSFDKPIFRNFFLTGVFFVLTCLFNWYYGLYIMIFSVLFFAYRVITGGSKILNKKVLSKLFITIILVVLILSPYVIYLFTYSQAASNFSINWTKNKVRTIGQEAQEIYSNLGLLLEISQFKKFIKARNIFSDTVNPFALLPLPVQYGNKMNRGIIPFFITYFTLFLVILGLFTRRKIVYFLIFIGIVFLMLSIGPYLYLPVKLGIFIPMPLLYIYKITPNFFQLIRPIKFFWVTHLCLALIAGLGFLKLHKSIKKNSLKRITALIIPFVLMIEYLLFLSYNYDLPLVSYPSPLEDTEIPYVYKIIKEIPGEFTIIELPFYLNVGKNSKYLYYQTYHHKKLVNGCTIPRKFKNLDTYQDFLINNELIRDILMIQEKIQINNLVIDQLSKDRKYNIRYSILNILDFLQQNKNFRLNQKYYKESIDELKRLKIKYIVLHKNFYSNGKGVGNSGIGVGQEKYFSEDVLEELKLFLGKLLGDPVYRTEDSLVYKIDLR